MIHFPLLRLASSEYRKEKELGMLDNQRSKVDAF